MLCYIANFLAQHIRELDLVMRRMRETPQHGGKNFFLSNVGQVHMHTNTVLRSYWGKPCFQDLSGQQASVRPDPLCLNTGGASPWCLMVQVWT